MDYRVKISSSPSTLNNVNFHAQVLYRSLDRHPEGRMEGQADGYWRTDILRDVFITLLDDILRHPFTLPEYNIILHKKSVVRSLYSFI